MEKMIVTFIKNYTPYIKGDVAHIHVSEYEALAKSGHVQNHGTPIVNETVEELTGKNILDEKFVEDKVDVVIPTKNKSKIKKKITKTK
jgi:hypothetical protein